jgi:hypothetical protein
LLRNAKPQVRVIGGGVLSAAVGWTARGRYRPTQWIAAARMNDQGDVVSAKCLQTAGGNSCAAVQ